MVSRREEILRILADADRRGATETARRLGIDRNVIYRWRWTYGTSSYRKANESFSSAEKRLLSDRGQFLTFGKMVLFLAKGRFAGIAVDVGQGNLLIEKTDWFVREAVASGA